MWKVAGKVFAIGGLSGDGAAFTFKVSPWAFEVLRSSPACARHHIWLQEA